MEFYGRSRKLGRISLAQMRKLKRRRAPVGLSDEVAARAQVVLYLNATDSLRKALRDG